MRAPHRAYHGFTLVELVAVIVILAILAAVALPRMTAASPFAARGYADVVAAHLRQARSTALASGCDVRFTIDGGGLRARQRAASGTHCASTGAWVTPVFDLPQPADAQLAANRQLDFLADGSASAPVTIGIGALTVNVDASGLVTGP